MNSKSVVLLWGVANLKYASESANPITTLKWKPGNSILSRNGFVKRPEPKLNPKFVPHGTKDLQIVVFLREKPEI